MKRFRVVPATEAVEGLCLYEDVRDRAGNLLLPKLAALTGATIKALLRRDVEALLIVDDTITDEQLAAGRLHVRERLDHLCRHAGTGRANALLRSVVEDYRIAELS